MIGEIISHYLPEAYQRQVGESRNAGQDTGETGRRRMCYACPANCGGRSKIGIKRIIYDWRNNITL